MSWPGSALILNSQGLNRDQTRTKQGPNTDNTHTKRAFSLSVSFVCWRFNDS